MLNSIERTSGIGKRDYAIMALSVFYGLRANDISSLKFSEISDGQLAFLQSKTSVMYQANLLDKVSEALQDYIQNGRPCSDCEYIFIRSSVPYRKLSRSSIWSIVCTHLMKSGINIGSRKRGPHAIRASLATHLVNNDVPYHIVQKILGHQDPNATKRYAAIDFNRLRSCALECPQPLLRDLWAPVKLTGIVEHFLDLLCPFFVLALSFTFRAITPFVISAARYVHYFAHLLQSVLGAVFVDE